MGTHWWPSINPRTGWGDEDPPGVAAMGAIATSPKPPRDPEEGAGSLLAPALLRLRSVACMGRDRSWRVFSEAVKTLRRTGCCLLLA